MKTSIRRGWIDMFVSIRKVMVATLAVPMFALVAFAGGGAGGGGTIAAPTVADSMGPLDLPGISIKNFGVVDGRIYRGGQPNKDEYWSSRDSA